MQSPSDLRRSGSPRCASDRDRWSRKGTWDSALCSGRTRFGRTALSGPGHFRWNQNMVGVAATPATLRELDAVRPVQRTSNCDDGFLCLGYGFSHVHLPLHGANISFLRAHLVFSHFSNDETIRGNELCRYRAIPREAIQFSLSWPVLKLFGCPLPRSSQRPSLQDDDKLRSGSDSR